MRVAVTITAFILGGTFINLLIFLIIYALGVFIAMNQPHPLKR